MASKVFVEFDEGMERLYPLKRPSEVTVKTKNESYTCRIDLTGG